MNPKVSIVILNWNGWKDTIECLESLYQITYSNYDVIVVDNGSEDESVQKIKEYCKGKIKVESSFFEYNPNNKPIHILEYTKEQAEKGGDHRKEKYFSKLESNRKLRLILNEKNYGFAEGNNIATRYALKALNPDYVLLLNNDTVVDREFLGELIKAGESDSRIGVIGPKIYCYHEPERIQCVGGKINRRIGRIKEIGKFKMERNQYNVPMTVDYVIGCSLLAKKEVIKGDYMLDPVYFAYFEEIDFCTKVSQIGYNCMYIPTAKIWHKKGMSSKDIKPKMTYYFSRNMLIYRRKFDSFFSNWAICLLFHHIWLFWKIMSYLLKGNTKLAKSTARGYIDALVLQ